MKDNMEPLLLFLFVALGIWIYQQEQNKIKQKPFQEIIFNENAAFRYQKMLTEYVNADLTSRKNRLENSKKPYSNDKRMAKELSEVIDKKIPEFEIQYKRLNEKFKFNLIELVDLSVDYRDWFKSMSDYYDPDNYALWNDSSWEIQQEAVIRVKEIEKRLKKKLKA